MIRLSTLRSCPVVCGEKRIGLLQGVLLNWQQDAAESLLIACGMRGKRSIPIADIVCMARDFILVRERGCPRRALQTENCRFVRDTEGLLTGFVRDYAIDEESFRVSAIEVVPGYLPGYSRYAVWVCSYSRQSRPEDELVIPSDLFAGPRSKWEEC